MRERLAVVAVVLICLHAAGCVGPVHWKEKEKHT